MSTPLHLQHTINAEPEHVFGALTTARSLEAWFAEHADVDLDAGRYDFWGRYTPEVPSHAKGHHRIELVEPHRRLRYKWHLRGVDTTVDIRLTKQGDDRTVIGVWHSDIPGIPNGQPGCYSMGDIWWLWLENLRRYAEGKPVTRCDFSAPMQGDVVQSIEIDGSREEVWNALTDPEARNRWIASGVTENIEVGKEWINWGEHGALKVLDIDPGKAFTLSWEIEDSATVVTWTLEGVGPKTHLTLAHSGFAPDRRSDAEWGGWISYLTLVQSMVEYGANWLPPIQEIVSGAAMYYAVSVWERQEELLHEGDWAV